LLGLGLAALNARHGRIKRKLFLVIQILPLVTVTGSSKDETNLGSLCLYAKGSQILDHWRQERLLCSNLGVQLLDHA
jgi:hypothetical protein